jgi:hypothetical protein
MFLKCYVFILKMVVLIKLYGTSKSIRSYFCSLSRTDKLAQFLELPLINRLEILKFRSPIR